MPLTARPTTAADTDVFLDMARAFHIEDGHALNAAGEKSIRDVAAGVALAPAFLLMENAETIGFFVLSLGYSPEHGGTDGFIDDIYIIPEARGHGLGRQALELALEESRKCGIRVLLLEVEAHNDRAYHLYTEMGFTDTKRRLMRLVLAQDNDD
jgi:ribosomal protein S18 acetylase RimI-like enzyme